MNNKTIIGGIVLLVVILGGMVLLSNKSKSNQYQQSQTPSQTTTAITGTPEKTMAQQEAVVNVTKTGFTPETVTIKSGMRVTWLNKTEEEVTVNSDDHPTHLLYRELNLGAFPNESSVQVVLTKPGKYTYHDHYHPNRKGTIIVE